MSGDSFLIKYHPLQVNIHPQRAIRDWRCTRSMNWYPISVHKKHGSKEWSPIAMCDNREENQRWLSDRGQLWTIYSPPSIAWILVSSWIQSWIILQFSGRNRPEIMAFGNAYALVLHDNSL